MNFMEYQARARETALPASFDLRYLALGLSGEAGEVANVLKKAFRDCGGEVSEERRDQITEEMGDALWYIAVLADTLGVDLGSIAEKNLAKLQRRYPR